MNEPANKFHCAIAQHHSRQQPGLKEYLKAVADADNASSVLCEADNLFHNGGKPCDCAGAQVISVGETSRENNNIRITKRRILVPDVVRLLVHNAACGVIRIMIAVRTRKHYNAKLRLRHRFNPSYSFLTLNE